MWCTDGTTRDSCSGFENARQKVVSIRRTSSTDTVNVSHTDAGDEKDTLTANKRRKADFQQVVLIFV